MTKKGSKNELSKNGRVGLLPVGGGDRSPVGNHGSLCDRRLACSFLFRVYPGIDFATMVNKHVVTLSIYKILKSFVDACRRMYPVNIEGVSDPSPFKPALIQLQYLGFPSFVFWLSVCLT